MTHVLRIDGEVERPQQLTYADLCQLNETIQVRDVSRFDPRRRGDAVALKGLLELAGASAQACYLGLHSSTDNFHASIPLAPVIDRAFLIYGTGDGPLDAKSGGPFRFFVPDHAACHTDEIDECANVKFVDHIELTAVRGLDNRPEDEQEHRRLHEGS